jgi:uncharacterized membrane protein
MFTVYNIALFLHVAAVIIWIGGLVAVSILNARLAREDGGPAMAPVARASRFFGQAVVGPAAVLTLIAGVIMVVDADLGLHHAMDRVGPGRDLLVVGYWSDPDPPSWRRTEHSHPGTFKGSCPHSEPPKARQKT